MSHCFHNAIDNPVIILPPTSSLSLMQNTDVSTSASRPQGHLVLVHGRSAMYFVGFIVELEVN